MSTCAQCGRGLPTPQSVCTACDAQLSSEHAAANAGPHECPACQLRFPSPERALWPENAPFYRPQSHRLRCPRCKVQLRDRLDVRASWWELPVLLATLFLVKHVVPGAAAMPAALSLLALYLVLLFVRRERDVAPANRYAQRD